MRTSRVLACIVLLFVFASASAQTTVLPAGDASGSDWPQWAGPDGNYTSPEKGLLREWPEGGPQMLWRAPIGQGWSCPSVAGNEVYVSSAVWEANGNAKETVVCLDAKTGKELWDYVYDTGVNYQGRHNIGWFWGGPRATPMVTEKYVYTLGLIGHLACLNRKTGKLVWEAGLDKTYWPGPYPEWKGVNFSLIVADGVVLIPFGADGVNRCAALDAETGKMKWLYPSDTKLPVAKGCYPGDRTPFIATFGTDRCAVLPGRKLGTSTFDHTGFPSFRALRLSDGKPVWEFDTEVGRSFDGAADMYLLGKQLIYSTALATISVDIDFKNAPFPAKVASVADYRANYHGVVPTGDAFYGLSVNGDANELPKWEGNVICLERATGKVMWQQKGFRNGVSMITADGLLFARSFQSLYLIEASPKGYIEKGKVEKLHDVTNANGRDGGWVMPVLSRGKLFIRTPNELICYKVSKN